ncbi:hypothetical protein OSTOST_11188 [Ostertagia ostertagi]
MAGKEGLTPSESGATTTISKTPRSDEKGPPTSTDQSLTRVGSTAPEEGASGPKEKEPTSTGGNGNAGSSTTVPNDTAHSSATTSGSVSEASSPRTHGAVSSKSPQAKIDRVSGRLKVEKGSNETGSSQAVVGTTTSATERPHSAMDRMTSPTGRTSTDPLGETTTAKSGLSTESTGPVTGAQEKTSKSTGEERQGTSTPSSTSEGAHVTREISSTTDVHGLPTSEAPSEVSGPRDEVDVTSTPDAQQLRTIEPGSSEVTKSDDKVSVTSESTPPHGDRTLTSALPFGSTEAEVTSEPTSTNGQHSATPEIPSKASGPGERIKATSAITSPAAQQSSTVPTPETREPNENLKITEEGSVPTESTLTNAHGLVTTASPSEVTGQGEEVKLTSSQALPDANRAVTSPSPSGTTESDGFTRPVGETDVTSRTTPNVPQPETTGSSSEAPIQFTGPGQRIDVTSSPTSAEQPGTPTTEVKQSTPPDSTSEATGHREKKPVSRTPQPSIQEPDGKENVTPKPTQPQVHQTDAPAPSSEAPIQFTGPADEGQHRLCRIPPRQSRPLDKPVQFTGPGQEVRTTSDRTPSSHVTKPDEADNVTSKPNPPGGQHSSSKPPDTTRPEPSPKVAQPDEKDDESSVRMMPTVHQPLTSTDSSRASTEPSGSQKKAEITSRPSPSAQHSSTSETPSLASTRVTGPHEGVDTVSSSTRPVTSVPSSEFTGPGEAAHVTPKQTAGPMIVIDGEMNPDHVHPEGVPGSKRTPKPSTDESPSGTHEGHKITPTPDTQDIHKPSPTKSPLEPEDEVSLTPESDLTKADETDAPGPTSKSGGGISMTPRPLIPDQHPSSLEPSSDQPNRATGPHGTFTPSPDSQNTQKSPAPGSSSGPGERNTQKSPAPGSSSGPGERVSVTPRPHVGENEKPDSLRPARVTPQPNLPGKQPSSPEPVPEQPSRATGQHGTFTLSPDIQNTQKTAPVSSSGPGDRVSVTPGPHVGENEKPIPEQPNRATGPHGTFTLGPNAQNTQKPTAPGSSSGPDDRAGITPRPHVG